MSSCWKENPLMRPVFSQISQQLKYFIREVKVTNGFSYLFPSFHLSYNYICPISLHPVIHICLHLPVHGSLCRPTSSSCNLLFSTAADPFIRIHSHPFIRIHSLPSACFSFRPFAICLNVHFLLLFLQCS